MRSRYRDALVHGQFRALFAAQLVSVTGTTVAAVALTVLVYDRTGSPFLSSLTFALGFVPYLFGGLLSALAERVPPRRLLVACASASAVVSAAMARPGDPTWLLLALLVCVGMLTSLSSGAAAALVRAVVPADAYVPARSLLRIVSQLAQIGGNAAGGAILIVLSPSGAILVNAVSFAVAAVVLRLGVRELEQAPAAQRRPGLLRDSLAGIGEIFADRRLRRLLLLGWLGPLCSVAPEALAAPYVARLGGAASLVGFWLVALPVGVIVGDLVGVWRLGQDRQRRLVAPMVLLSFVPYLAFAATPPFAVALPLLALSGAGSIYGLGLDLRVRDAVPEHRFGRVMTVNSAGMMTLQGLGFALAGAVAQLVGAPATIAAAGVGGIVVAVLLGPWRDGQASDTVVSPRVSA